MAVEVELPQTREDKVKASERAVELINKDLGKGSIFSMGSKVGLAVPVVPTGIYQIDNDLLGCGGFPRGRMVELLGENGGGKSTLALMTVASAQRAGGLAAYIDMENALDPSYAAKLDVNVEEMLVSQPSTAEEAFEITQRLAESGAFSVIVIDSVAALTSRAEMEGDFGTANVASTARLMTQALRKLIGIVNKSQVLLIFINQIRASFSMNFGGASSVSTPGGKALKFYVSQRVQITRIGQVKGSGEEVVGNRTLLKCIKNRLASPFRQVEVDLMYGVGFDREGSLLDAAIEKKVVVQSGSWFSYKGTKLGQGRPAAKKFIAEADNYSKIEKEIMEARTK